MSNKSTDQSIWQDLFASNFQYNSGRASIKGKDDGTLALL